MSEETKIEWPREIWAAEREDHDQGVGRHVFSEFATVARFEGDQERECEFHRYVDADIHESQERYYRHQLETERDTSAKITKLLAAAGHASSAAADMIEVARDGEITPHDNVGSGDTLTILADGMRLLIDAVDDQDEGIEQLHGALIRFLEDRT